MLDGTDLFLYKYYTKQPLPFPFRIVVFIYGASVNVVDDDFRSFQSRGDLDGQILGCFSLSFNCVDVLFQVPSSDQSFHWVVEAYALFSGMTINFVVGTLPAPVPFCRIYLMIGFERVLTYP